MLGVFPNLQSRPCWRVYTDDFSPLTNSKIYKAGVWLHDIKEKKEGPVPVDTWVCTPLYVNAITSDGHGRSFGRLLRIRNRNGGETEWAMPMSMLSGSFDEGRAELLDMGLEFDSNHRSKIIDYIFSQQPEVNAIAVNSTGWAKHEDSGQMSFVMPNQLIGGGNIFFQAEQSGHKGFSTSGSISTWQKGIGYICQNNPILMLAVCSALAGPLLYLLHKGNGGFHFVGDSSCGKSTALQVACSVWGQPDQLIKTWSATGNGLEGIATQRNDTVLALDEMGEADPRGIGNIVYSLGNGTGKQRANVKGNARSTKKWRLMLLSSGERTLDSIMNEAGKRSTAGQQIRLLDIPVTGKSGVFNDLHNTNSGRELSDTLSKASNEHFGHIGPAFVQNLIDDSANDISKMFEEIKSSFEASTNQEGRASDRFCTAALAGELAIFYKLLPWEKGSAIDAALSLFKLWKSDRGEGDTEDKQILEMVSDFIEKYGESRFTNLNPSSNSFDSSSNNNSLNSGVRAGYWIENNGTRGYRFSYPGLKEATKSYDINRVRQALHKAGWIDSTEAKVTRTPEKTMKLYSPIFLYQK